MRLTKRREESGERRGGRDWGDALPHRVGTYRGFAGRARRTCIRRFERIRPLACPGNPGQVVTMIGHQYNPNGYMNPICNVQYNGLILPHIVSWQPTFIIHDDAKGPYQLLQNELPALDEQQQKTSTFSIDRANFFITMTPKEVCMSASDARERALSAMLFLAEKITDPERLKSTAVVRQFLIRSKEFKRELSSRRHMDAELLDIYMKLPMPKYIWVIELVKKGMLSNLDVQERMSMGEVIIDSTGAPHGHSVLSTRQANFLLARDTNDFRKRSALKFITKEEITHQC